MLVSKNREQRWLKAKKSIGIEPMLTRDLIKKGVNFNYLYHTECLFQERYKTMTF